MEVGVSMLDGLFDGSMVGRERLMQAREFYAPSRPAPAPQTAFARWTERITVQSEVGSAREMAGLDNAELSLLAGEFVRCPTRPRAAWARHGLWVGAILIAFAFLGLFMADMDSIDTAAARALTVLALGFLCAGSACMALSGLKAFGGMHLDLGYGTTGLYVGVLNEQHPWLYKTLALLQHEAAERYRQSVLRERGPLRGLDYVMMREIVAAQEALDRLRPARAVAEQIQAEPDTADAVICEPRLVQVTGATFAASRWQQLSK